MDLDALEAAIDAGEYEQALELALIAWRSAPHPELEELIERLATKIHEPQERIEGDFHAAWMEIAAQRSTADLHFLLASFFHGPRTHVEPDVILERIDAITGWPADPRLLAFFKRRAAYPILPGRKDRATIHAQRFSELAARDRRAPPPPLTAEDRERINTFFHRPRSADPAAEELYARILADPTDDAARLVYADLLLEREDPRGEFFVLQFRHAKSALSEEEERRMHALSDRHGREWIGHPLAAVLSNLTFRRGMLEEATLVDRDWALDRTWKAAVHAPELATLRRLERGSSTVELYQSFVFSEQMRSLEVVVLCPLNMVDELVSRPRPFKRLELFMVPLLPTLELLESAKLDALRVLAFPASPDELLELYRTKRQSPLWSRLDRLVFKCVLLGETDFGLWWSALSELEPIRELEVDAGTVKVVVRRRERGVSVTVDYLSDWGIEPVLRAIRRRVVDFELRPKFDSSPSPALVALLKQMA